METDKHYFRVGLYLAGLTLAAALFTIWLINNGSNSDERYRIFFSESVSGLSEGNQVKYRGVNVGTVEAISIHEKDTRLIQVDVRIRADAPIKADTVAALKMQGITGSVFIELSSEDDPNTAELKDFTKKGEVPIIPSRPSSITAIMNQLPQIMDRLAVFGEQINKLASDENIASLKQAMDNIASSSNEINMILKDTRGNIIDSTEQVNSTMHNMRRASHNINIVTERVKDEPSSLLFPSKEGGIEAP